MLRDGQPIEIEPLTAGGVVDFGEPIGRAETIYTLHSELRTFAESFGCRSASFRLSLAPPLLAGLRDLVGMPADEIAAAAARRASPSNETVSVHLVKVTAESGATVTVRALRPSRISGSGARSSRPPRRPPPPCDCSRAGR